MQRDPICYFCDHDATDDDYCYGCGQYVCAACNDVTLLSGSHDPYDHMISSDENDPALEDGWDDWMDEDEV